MTTKRAGSKKLDYAAYLQTEHWVMLSRRLRAERGCCFGCGATDALEGHHKTYARLGCERDADIVVVCRSCHQEIHDLILAGNSRLSVAHFEVRKKHVGAPVKKKHSIRRANRTATTRDNKALLLMQVQKAPVNLSVFMRLMNRRERKALKMAVKRLARNGVILRRKGIIDILREPEYFI